MKKILKKLWDIFREKKAMQMGILKFKDILYLGSQSKSRQRLLKNAGISFKILQHKSDECGVDLEKNFEKYVLGIAQHKMENLDLPNFDECKKDTIFVLTADTLVKTVGSDEILGKPIDENDATRMLDLLCKQSARVVTACCLDKKRWESGSWQTVEQKHWTTNVLVDFCVQPEDRGKYVQKVGRITEIAGAACIEDYGQNFLKSVQGSYTAVLGLPMFELRKALRELNFRI